MIIGIGTDITSADRFTHLINHERFLKRLLTQNELKYYYDKYNTDAVHQIHKKSLFLAKRWATKEAVSKALGTGIGRKCSFQDIETSRDLNGKPLVHLSPLLLKKLPQFKENLEVHLSYSDEKNIIIAFVIIVLSKNS